MKRVCIAVCIYLLLNLPAVALSLMIGLYYPPQGNTGVFLIESLLGFLLGIGSGIVSAVLMIRQLDGRPLFPWWGRNDDDRR